jgi:hypothetical protein
MELIQKIGQWMKILKIQMMDKSWEVGKVIGFYFLQLVQFHSLFNFFQLDIHCTTCFGPIIVSILQIHFLSHFIRFFYYSTFPRELGEWKSSTNSFLFNKTYDNNKMRSEIIWQNLRPLRTNQNEEKTYVSPIV